MSRVCLECKEVIYGRSDKKFCDSACRNLYHNRLLKAQDNGLQHIQSTLKNNRRILAYLYQQQTDCTLNKDTLEAMGYNFAFHTHEQKQGKKVYVFCLDYGFVLQESAVKILPFKLP